MSRNGPPPNPDSSADSMATPPVPPVAEPAPAPLFNAPQPTTPQPAGDLYFTESPGSPDGADLQFLTMDDIARRTPAPTAPRPPTRPTPSPAPPAPAAAAAHPDPSPAPAVAAAPIAPPTATAPQPAPAPEPQPLPPTPDSHPTASGAATQIAELLRAAHDTAARLRSHAEVEVKRTVDAARAEVQAHKQNQMRVLDAEQAAAEQLHAEIVHNARLAATEVRNRAEEEAAEIKAAAQAVLAQAAAHAHAAKALVAHNLAEIEAAKQTTAARGSELIGAGRHMIATIEGLDDNLSDRLVHTDEVIEWAQEATRAAS